MKMKTLAVNGHQFRVNDDGAVRYDEAQTLADKQKMQARENISAAKKIEDGIIIEGKSGHAYIEVYDKADETGYKHTALYFLGHEDDTVKLSRLTDGEQNWDAATVGQVNAALEEKQEQIDALTDHAAYKNLYGTAQITAEDIAAAGDEGITVITIGSEDVDLSKYHDILVRVYVPADDSLGSSNGNLTIYSTSDSACKTGDANCLLRVQGTAIASGIIKPEKVNYIAIKANFADDTFLYGEIFKNSEAGSYGYPGSVNGWVNVSSGFQKSKKKFFHICSNGFTFKFPAGSCVAVYGR